MCHYISDFFKELHRRNKVFFYLGIGLFALFLISLITLAVCQYSLADICHWLKPSKFTLSFAVYVLSLGWYLEYLKNSLGERKIERISWLIAILIVIEMAVILTQSGLASGNDFSSYFSKDTTESLKSHLHFVGNTTIIANTVIGAYIGIQFFRKIPLKPVSYLWGIRSAFVTFILSGFLGAFLLKHYGPMPPDPNNYGLPFMGFSSIRDNLISLHFLGIHCLQFLPICCYFFQNYIGKIFVLSYTGLYTILCVFFILKA